MHRFTKTVNNKKYTFTDTSFDKLMQRRIYKVLLICNTYDAFMLEEDGRIDEQIFNEYYAQNLRYPPVFIQANTVRDAYRILEEENIDLIITMLTIESTTAFKLAKGIKNKYPNKPIVVLTPFSREVSLLLESEDVSAIDYIFCWLGNADLLLAIIKLIEDSMNIELDIEEAGVQALLLIEDSVRYYSSYLPHIYKIIFHQSKRSMLEGANPQQKMLVMRGRPKILLATNYEQALDFYRKYKDNILGIISDISYKRENIKDPNAGFRLCKLIKQEDPLLPFLLQSSDIKNSKKAAELNVGFIHKYSKTLSIELKDYIVTHLAFGDFVFVNPETGIEISRATNLKSLQKTIMQIPDESVAYHVNHNHFSKWMNARGLFSIAKVLKPATCSDFSSVKEIKIFIHDIIDIYRKYRGKGIIAKFDSKNYDEYFNFSRIGDGSIGGKARGLAFIDLLIKKYKLADKYEGVNISIPRSVVLSSDIFDDFMEANSLYKIALSKASDADILKEFVLAKLPDYAIQELSSFISLLNNPIAIRSSSKLEDSHYQPFAGIYSTYMIPNIKSDLNKTIKLVCEAIKSVYASVFFKSSKAYMTVTTNVIDEEKMGIVLQEVVGTQHDDYFYPTFSGVARSINFYPIGHEKPEDGIATIAFGLGKYIVDGGKALMFSPKYPKKVLQLSTPEMAVRDSQKYFYALNLMPDSFTPSVDDGVNIAKLDIKNGLTNKSFRYIVSTYDYHNHMLRDGLQDEGLKVVTFSSILNYNVFPLVDILNELLEVTQKEIGNPVEIEFAVNLDTGFAQPKLFSFLQVRPIVDNKEIINVDLNKKEIENALIFSESALGNGIISNISDIVYVKPDVFDPSKTHLIANSIEKINESFMQQDKHYILIGPGRWGSSDPWLGVPVKWSQICNARIIIESGLQNYRIDPSQGTHFFQNLTSFRVGYFTINPFINDGVYNIDLLNNKSAEFEDDYIKHVKFDKPLSIKIDGRNNTGIINI